jgi:hypothetical protein
VEPLAVGAHDASCAGVENPLVGRIAVIADTRSEGAMDLGSIIIIGVGVGVEDSYDIVFSNCDVRFRGGCAR